MNPKQEQFQPEQQGYTPQYPAEPQLPPVTPQAVQQPQVFQPEPQPAVQQPVAQQPIAQEPQPVEQPMQSIVQTLPEPANQQPAEQIQHQPAADQQFLQWQASEYITREKNRFWFVWLIGGALVLAALAFFVLDSPTFALLIVVMAVAIAVLARRPAQNVTYQLSSMQLTVNEKKFPLHDFRAFGVIQEGALYSIALVPVKRFRPSVNVYFPPDMGEQIVDVLGGMLPMEEMHPDVIDRITEKLNF